jgi:hypothetical protein
MKGSIAKGGDGSLVRGEFTFIRQRAQHYGFVATDCSSAWRPTQQYRRLNCADDSDSFPPNTVQVEIFTIRTAIVLS